MAMNADSDRADVPLILFSGMGADASIFQQQKLAFPKLTVPTWPAPYDGDDLTSYCARFADTLDPHRPCIVGGASFGGIVALEMTRHLDALACLLIGSVGGPSQLPKRVRLLRPFSPALNMTPITMLQKSAASAVVAASKVDAKHLASISRQFSEADANVLRWSARQILSWNSSYDDIDVRHIHGDRDHVFPISCVDPDEVVFGGGHVISMTHGEQVNEFLRKHITQITAA